MGLGRLSKVSSNSPSRIASQNLCRRSSSAVALDQRAPSRRVVAAASTDARLLHRGGRSTAVANVREGPHVLHTVLSERATMGFEDPYL